MTHPAVSRRLRLRNGALLATGVLLAAAAVALATTHTGGLWGLVLATGALGLLAFLVGALRVAPELLNWGVALILAALVIGVALSPAAISPLVLVEGACLYAAAELGWMAAAPPQVLTASSLLLRGAIVLGGLAAGYLALFGLALPFGGGPLLTVFGVAAAVVVFFLLRGRRPAGGAGTPRRAPRR